MKIVKSGNKFKKAFEYNCLVCGKTGYSVDKDRLKCNKCKSWAKAGKNQLKLSLYKLN